MGGDTMKDKKKIILSIGFFLSYFIMLLFSFYFFEKIINKFNLIKISYIHYLSLTILFFIFYFFLLLSGKLNIVRIYYSLLFEFFLLDGIYNFFISIPMFKKIG